MVGPTLRKVQRGQPLSIPAETFNTFIDAAQDYKSRQHRQGPNRTPGTLPVDVVLVQNASGADRQRFDLLGIDQPLITPSDNLREFQNHPVLSGVTPTVADHRGRFVVLLEPVAKGEIGRGLIGGITPVRLRIVQESDGAADVDDESPTRLKSAASGAAQILWTEPGEGEERWGLVRLGPFVPQPFFARLTDRHGEHLSPAFSWREVELALTSEGPTWQDRESGRRGTWNGAHPAYEINGLRATLDEDLQVVMWQERDGRYYFDAAHTGFGNEQPEDRKVYQPLTDPHVDPPFEWEINAQPRQGNDPTRAHHGVVVLLKVKDPAIDGEQGELWIDAHFDTLGHLVRLDLPPDLSSSSESESGSSSDSSSSSSSSLSSSGSSESLSSSRSISSSLEASSSSTSQGSSGSDSVSSASQSHSASGSSTPSSGGSQRESNGSGGDGGDSGSSQALSEDSSGDPSGSAETSSGGSESDSTGISSSGSQGSSSSGTEGSSDSGSSGSGPLSGSSSSGVWNCEGRPGIICNDCAPQPEGFIVSADLGCLTIDEAPVLKLPHLGCTWYSEPLNCNITIAPAGPALTPGGPPTLRVHIYVYATDPPVDYYGYLCTCSQTSIVPIQGGGGDCTESAELILTPYF